jgi:hypothetical protein
VKLFKAEEMYDVFLGITNNHNFNGTDYSTYQTATPWINKVSSFTLTDFSSINTLEQLFVNMLDPVTGKPIMIDPKQLFVMPTLKYTARRILHGTTISTGNFATSGVPIHTESANVLDTNYRLYSSALARQRLTNSGVSASNADAYVVLGDFKKAFVYREVFGMETQEAPPQSPEEFKNDIVLQVKAREFGKACVRDPRYSVLAINA